MKTRQRYDRPYARRCFYCRRRKAWQLCGHCHHYVLRLREVSGLAVPKAAETKRRTVVSNSDQQTWEAACERAGVHKISLYDYPDDHDPAATLAMQKFVTTTHSLSILIYTTSTATYHVQIAKGLWVKTCSNSSLELALAAAVCALPKEGQ
jgi:hypothetical protein